jgi:hypothetical protein
MIAGGRRKPRHIDEQGKALPVINVFDAKRSEGALEATH